MAPAVIPLIQNVGLEIQRAKNMHQFRSLAYLGISIWFTHLWNEIGTAIGTTISLLVANGLIMNIYYRKKIGVNIIAFWKSIASALIGMVLPVVFGILMMVYYHFNSFLTLFFSYSFIP